MECREFEVKLVMFTGHNQNIEVFLLSVNSYFDMIMY